MDAFNQLAGACKALFQEPSLQNIYDVMNGFNALIWGPPMIFLLLFLGIYFTVKLRFIQKYTWPAMKLSVAKAESDWLPGPGFPGTVSQPLRFPEAVSDRKVLPGHILYF